VHGTMLYDTDMVNMVNAITPSSTKLQSKGIKSVESRITTLSQHLSMSIGEFKTYVKDNMCDGEMVLEADDLNGIEEIMKSYLAPEFIMGNNPRCNMERKQHIDGVGEIEIKFELVHNTIQNLNIAGDFFLLGDIDKAIIDKLNGTSLTRAAVENALKHVEVPEIIVNLTNKQFINLLIN
ncbi:MAG: lipoyltransferase, partial [Bacteroidales bacterium]|nr:lipoyltransferase [Candidatus Sodaliphilus fimicaballi]